VEHLTKSLYNTGLLIEHILKFLKLFLLFEEYFVPMQTSLFHMTHLIFTANYEMDNFFENFNVSNPKFKRIVFQLLKCLN